MECLFCKMVNNEIDKYLIYEDDLVIVILDKFPHNDGHSLIIPKNHYQDLFSLPNNINNHMKMIAEKMIEKLMKKLNVKGITCLVNYGDSQAIKHLHYHLIPNYNNKKPEKTIDEVFDIIIK